MTPTPMSTLLTTLGEVVTKVMDWIVGSNGIVESIVSQPLLLVTTGVLMLGAAIGILGRLLSRS